MRETSATAGGSPRPTPSAVGSAAEGVACALSDLARWDGQGDVKERTRALSNLDWSGPRAVPGAM